MKNPIANHNRAGVPLAIVQTSERSAMNKSLNQIFLATAVLLSTLITPSLWAQSNEVEFEYDARGRLVTISNSDGEAATYTLDDAGNRIAMVNGGGEPKITSFMAPDTAMYSDASLGNHVVFSWTSVNTSGCELYGSAINGTHNQAPSGQTTLLITQGGTFQLKCSFEGVDDVVTRSFSFDPANGGAP